MAITVIGKECKEKIIAVLTGTDIEAEFRKKK